VPAPSDSAPVRLAEIVAALSLGIDLGFSQPMEHVLRQCLIALRLAECILLDDEQRAAVYYSALLVNVGCHSDAHEQAKWFGDDIAMKSRKYDHPLRSVAGAVGMLRLVGRGQPLLHRGAGWRIAECATRAGSGRDAEQACDTGGPDRERRRDQSAHTK
jgi:hypothetical protein